MKVKKQVKKLKKTVMKQPALMGAIITGAMGVVGTAGVAVSKMKKKKNANQNTASM